MGQSFSSNDSLPLNVTTAKGNNATFECELGTFYRNDYSDHYTFHYSLVSQDNNTSIPVWNRTCRAGEVPHYCWTADGSDEDYVLSITTTQKEEASVKFRFNFQVSNVDTKHNNSVFSCAILSAGQIQWLHTAHLTVTAMKERSSQQDAHTMVMVIVISIMVLLVVSGAALVLTGVIMLAKRKWKRRRIGELESDRGMPRQPTEYEALHSSHMHANKEPAVHMHGPAITHYDLVFPTCLSPSPPTPLYSATDYPQWCPPNSM